MPSSICVEVAYALEAKQVIIEVMVTSGCTVKEVIYQSGILNEFPDIDLEHDQVGIFGEKKSLDTTVCEGDRIEIYRPLRVSAKEARRLRAAARTKALPTK